MGEFTLKTTNDTNYINLILIKPIREIRGQRLFRADSWVYFKPGFRNFKIIKEKQAQKQPSLRATNGSEVENAPSFD